MSFSLDEFSRGGYYYSRDNDDLDLDEFDDEDEDEEEEDSEQEQDDGHLDQVLAATQGLGSSRADVDFGPGPGLDPELTILESAAHEMDDDFDRLIENLRRPTGEDLLARDWDAIAPAAHSLTSRDAEEEFRNDLRAASGIGKPRQRTAPQPTPSDPSSSTQGQVPPAAQIQTHPKPRQKRARPAPPLSHEVKFLIGSANQAYINGDIAAAFRTMQDVIRIEPRAVQAWSVLAQCYDDQGDGEKALRARIMAAHLRWDAEEWEGLARESRKRGYVQQALYCYRKVYSLEPDNVSAIWDRATLAIEARDLRLARSSLLAVLKQLPHNLTVLDAIRPILVELGEFEQCATLFHEAMNFWMELYPVPTPDPSAPDAAAAASTTNGQPEAGPSTLPGLPPIDPALLSHSDYPGQLSEEQNTGSLQPLPFSVRATSNMFTQMHLLVLADLYTILGRYESAVHTIRKGARWFQGRASQRWWDAWEDDREYDGGRENARQGAVASTGYHLDLNLRHRLAIARIKMGDLEEGTVHAQIVLDNDTLDYAALFLEIADAYFERDMWAEARGVYERLGVDENTSSIYVLMQTAACMKMMNELKEAAEVYDHIRKSDPSANEAKMKLAEIYEIINEPRKALELVYEVIASRKRGQKDPLTPNAGSPAPGQGSTGGGGLLFEEPKTKGKSGVQKKPKLTSEQLKELEAQKEKEVLSGFKRVRQLWEPVFGAPYPIPTGDSAGAEATRDEEGGITDVRMPGILNDEGNAPDGYEGAGSLAEREWLLEAEKLVETYRETRALFTTSRLPGFRGMFPSNSKARHKTTQNQEDDQDRMASRLHLEMEMESAIRKKIDPTQGVTVFRGVDFRDWLRLFLAYAFLLTKREQHSLAEEVLRHLLTSNPYLRREHQLTLRLALIACALHVRNHLSMIEHARKIIGIHQFNNEGLRILVSSLPAGLQSTDAFITSTLQKHLSRDIRLAHAALQGEETLRWNNSIRRWAAGGPTPAGLSKEDDGDEDGDGEGIVVTGGGKLNTPTPLPTKPNPVLTAVYGQICVAAKSYQSALFYLLHAYEHCPEDPVLCLSLAIASIGRAMQRQADNRHHLITQGIAFLSTYRKVRKEISDNEPEIDYNFGRAFHQLGLLSLAVRHYEKVLELASAEPQRACGIEREAAYNCAMIFVQTGAKPLADQLYRRWLSI